MQFIRLYPFFLTMPNFNYNNQTRCANKTFCSRCNLFYINLYQKKKCNILLFKDQNMNMNIIKHTHYPLGTDVRVFFYTQTFDDLTFVRVVHIFPCNRFFFILIQIFSVEIHTHWNTYTCILSLLWHIYIIHSWTTYFLRSLLKHRNIML